MSGSQSEHRTEQEKEPILQCPYTDKATLDSGNISVSYQIGISDSDSYTIHPIAPLYEPREYP